MYKICLFKILNVFQKLVNRESLSIAPEIVLERVLHHLPDSALFISGYLEYSKYVE